MIIFSLLGAFLYWMIIGAIVAFVILCIFTAIGDYITGPDDSVKSIQVERTKNSDGTVTTTTTTTETTINGTSTIVEKVTEG